VADRKAFPLAPDNLATIAGAMVAVDDVQPRRRSDDRRIPGDERNLDRAAELVMQLAARGFVLIAKRDHDRATLIERAAADVARVCADLDTQGTEGAGAALDGLDLALRVAP
jgi:hypothetical protein